MQYKGQYKENTGANKKHMRLLVVWKWKIFHVVVKKKKKLAICQRTKESKKSKEDQRLANIKDQIS